jgi:hypothetical protein
MKVAHGGAVTHFESELFFEPAMDLEVRPVKLSSLTGIL